MKPPHSDGRLPSPWADLEGTLGDAFELVLAHLAPADVAACRLVSRGWRREVSLLLQQLQPAVGVAPADVAAAFPHLVCLQLTACPSPGSSPSGSPQRGGGGGEGEGEAGPDGGQPPLRGLPRLRRLRRLSLRGRLSLACSGLDCRALLPLAGAAAFRELEASCLEVRHAAALQLLPQLRRLHLAVYSLEGWGAPLPALLAPLSRLEHLHFACIAPGGGALPDIPGAGGGSGSVGGGWGPAGQLSGLSQLSCLSSLELCCPDGASDAVCREVAAGPLPRLARLALHRCDSFGRGAPSVGDAGLEWLCRRLGGQLTSLALTGHTQLSDEGIAHLPKLACSLRHLELRPAAPAPNWPWRPEVTDEGLAMALAPLTRLSSLHLGGHTGLGEATCAALGRRLRGLSALVLSDCAGLDDSAAFRLAPLAPGLRRLGLRRCPAVSDMSLAALLRGAAQLARLELAGCHRNVTGLGLRAMGSLRRLRHLDLAGCDAITDAEIEALLPAARSLEHLDLGDCRVSDRACQLLAAAAPHLRWLSLEHCQGVSNRGLLHLAAGLPQLAELRLFGSGVSEAAVAQLRRTPRGRRVRFGLHKHCWWLPPEAAALVL